MKLKGIKEAELNEQTWGACVLDKDFDVWQLHVDGEWYTPLLDVSYIEENVETIRDYGPWYLIITGEEIVELESD